MLGLSIGMPQKQIQKGTTAAGQRGGSKQNEAAFWHSGKWTETES